MAIDVVIPKMGMTMESGTLVEWLVPDGASVTEGQVLFHLVTEKLDCDVEAEGSGVLVQLVAADTTLEPGGLVGRLLSDDERDERQARAGSVEAGGSSATRSPDRRRRFVTPNARRIAAQLGVDLADLTGSGPNGRITTADVQAAAAPAASTGPDPGAAGPLTSPQESAGPASRRAVSPIARKLAASLGVDLEHVTGSGPGGRITRQDVESAAAAPPAADAPPEPAPQPAGSTDVTVRASTRLVGMRGTIARRMHASLQDMAQLTLFAEVDMTRAFTLRKRLTKHWAADRRAVPTYTDLVIKATADSLPGHPALNARVTPDAVEQLAEIHIGLAVALDAGLVVPVLRHTDRLSLEGIAERAKAMASAARGQQLDLDELAGSTFSITSLGAFGIDGFTPVVNPPNVAILGIGRVRDVAVPTSKQRTERRRHLTLSLTFDHRAVDGAPAATFLAEVRDRLEAPLRLLR